MTSTAWYMLWPGDAYAMGPVRFKEPKTEAEFRAYAREWAGVKRLPEDFQCWTAN